MTWITDKNGNRASVERWGSPEAAQAALDSLTNCSDCSDCSACSRCSACSACSDCSRCYGCSDCSACSDCSRCSACSSCSRCYDCSDCSSCSRCSSCSSCSDCSDCSRLKEEKQNAITIPVIANIHKAIYEAVTAKPRSLEMGTWHTCETTHCRAGWVVTLAGPDGKALENRFNTELAAMMIYDASDPNYKINPSRFYDSNEAALEDMRKLAEKG